MSTTTAIDLIPALLAAAAKGQTLTVAAVVDTFDDTEALAVNHRVAVCHATADGERVLAAVLARRVATVAARNIGGEVTIP